MLNFIDGHANAGIQSVDGLQKLVTSFYQSDGITTSTFGIGSDFNENLMKGFYTGNVWSYVKRCIQCRPW